MKNILNKEFYFDRSLEITTNIGCKVACTYCPQKTFYKNFKSTKKSLSLIDFKTIIDKLPNNTEICFAGFSEPFLNDECSEMIEYAYKKKFKLILFSTLEGFNIKDLHIFRDRYFYYINLHLPSKENNMNIEIDDNYIENLREILKYFKDKDKISIFGSTINEKLDFIPESLVTVNRANSRASNLNSMPQVNKRNFSHIYCSHNRLIKNVLLPDGTVTLCCMDWSTKHKLGNILYHSYDEVFNNDTIKKIRKDMSNNKSDLLCWNCEYALPYY
jgi:radical SAM protein with 4Fe4S-binding SPASM domain